MKLFKGNKGFLLGLLNAESDLASVKENTVDASLEKHVPVVKVEGNKVSVRIGSVDHPMLDVHYIEMIIIETKKGLQVKYLNPGEEPYAEFLLEDDEFVAAYEYCNLHGLWKYGA